MQILDNYCIDCIDVEFSGLELVQDICKLVKLEEYSTSVISDLNDIIMIDFLTTCWANTSWP